ncbi:TPA: MFS transporter [Klebsiella variicola subsp. variicola]|nr:MFS transporter [Klebsiella variicola subsp. variicola]
MQRTLLVVLACHFLAAFTVLGVPLFLPRLLTAFDIGEKSLWAGVLFSLPAVMTALSSAWWGRFADRYGRRLSLQRALLGLMLAFILAGIAPSLPWLIVALALQGLAGGTLAAANGYLSMHMRGEELAKALNWTQFSARLALLSAPPLTGAILMQLPHIGQRLWLGLSILPLCGFLLSLRLPVDVTDSLKTSSINAVSGKKTLLHLWAMQFLFNFAMVVTFPYFLPYAAHWLHQDVLIGVFYSWPHLIYLLLLPLWHRLRGRSGFFVAGMLLLALAALWHTHIGGPVTLLTARTLFGVGMLLAYSGANQMLSDSIRQRSAGKQFGQIDAAGKWAGVAAGISAGWLVTHYSLQLPYLASAVAALSAVFIFVISPLRGSDYVRISRGS